MIGPQRSKKLGQTLVEFAMCLPLLIILLFGIIEFSYYMFVLISVNNATRQATRRAAMNNLTQEQIKGIVVSSAVGVALSSAQITITTRVSDPDFVSPENPPTVMVSTNFDHQFFVSRLLNINSLPIKSVFKMIVVTYSGSDQISF